MLKNTQVRKSAVLCLEKYLPYVAEADFSAAIEILKRLCLDESHVVRKQAADAITCLLSGIDEGSDRWHIVANSWILNVFPLIGDSDATVAELVAKLVLELVLNPLIEASMGNVQVRGLAAEILKRIYPGSSSRSEFIRALREQASHNRLNSIIVNNVQRQLENSTSEEDTSELWTLFECLVVVFPDKIDSKLVFNKWFSFTHPPRPLMMKNDWIPTPTIPYGKTASLLLSIIRLIKKKFSADERRLLCTNLEEHLNGYTVPTDLINEVWLTLATLADHQKSGDIKHESPELQLFASRTYRFALQVIKNIWKASCIEEQLTFLKYQVEEQAETFLVRMLIGTGYAAQYNLDVIYLLDQDEIDDIREEPLLISFLLKITTDSLSDLRFRLKESRKNIKLDKGRHPFGLPTKRNGKWAPESDWLKQRLVHSDVVSNFPMKKFSDGIRAAAAIAIGTHCIFDGELTKEFLPELINELQASSSAAVRANLLVPCCDMVKRFAATDIQGLPDALAIVLLDPHPHIRAQCLQMMAHLIKEQFVKWEGLIMHLYTIMCIDDSPETASFAQSSFQNALLPIMDDMLYSNFMEFLLFYNNAPYTWDEEQGLVNAARRRIRVDGYGSDASRFIWRQTILRFILSTFTDFQRFGTMVRMCNDIIMQIAKGGSDITDYTISNLVNDCLELMSCDEMSFSYTLGKKTGADGGDPDDEPNDAIHAKATEALMTAYRNGLQQKILPVLFDVLFIFEKKRLGAFARKTLFTIELLCKDHIEHVDTMIMALCPGRAKQILQEMTDPKGLVQKELALRKRDEERDREADLQLLLANLQNKNVPPTTPFALRTPRVKRATMMHGAMVEEPVNQTFATQQIKEEEEENRPNLTSTPLQTALRPTAPLKALTIAAIRNDNLRFVVDALTPKSKQRQEQAVPTPVQPSFAANLANIDEDESDELPTIIPPRRFSVVTSPKTTATKEETMDSLATALAATNTSPDNEPMEEAIESSTKKSGGDDSISSRLKSRKRRSLNQSSAKVEQTKEPNLSTDQASTSVLEVSATEQRQSRRKSSINVNPIVTIRKVPLKGETGEEKENEVGSNLPVQQPTLNIMNDETMIGGRAFSTPNKDPNAMELTFAGLDFSVIAKEPGTARTRRVRPSTSEQND
ncbi:unnamed protein product, partial [Mesorhabditis belari]|uniref:Condensin complex subunit 1 C-terminal domain-containing protein n=1 Tax=Mesorhabditis belari TaxID=2138241 RepID=A0AAF3F2H9_9BILA